VLEVIVRDVASSVAKSTVRLVPPAIDNVELEARFAKTARSPAAFNVIAPVVVNVPFTVNGVGTPLFVFRVVIDSVLKSPKPSTMASTPVLNVSFVELGAL
jgi:hypothetical protein